MYIYLYIKGNEHATLQKYACGVRVWWSLRTFYFFIKKKGIEHATLQKYGCGVRVWWSLRCRRRIRQWPRHYARCRKPRTTLWQVVCICICRCVHFYFFFGWYILRHYAPLLKATIHSLTSGVYLYLSIYISDKWYVYVSMCVCVCVCVCVYVYMYICIHIDKYMYMYMYVYIYVHLSIYKR